MDKYALKNRCHPDHQIQFYIYDFVCVDLETITEEDYLPDTNFFVKIYKEISTPGPVLKH